MSHVGRQAAAFGLVLLLCGGCTESSFSGNGGKEPARKDDPVESQGDPEEGGDARPPGQQQGPDGQQGPSDGPDPGDVTIGDDCTEAGATQAKLLTNTVQNGTPGNYVEYEIFLTDCEGEYKTVESASILFDIDGSTTGVTDPLSYSIKNRNISGSLETIRGTDLFGKSGPTFYHNKTDQPVSIDSPTDSVILRIDLGGKYFSSIGGNTPGVSTVLATYLRFGDASPVRKDVKFIGGTPPTGGGIDPGIFGSFGSGGGYGGDYGNGDYGG